MVNCRALVAWWIPTPQEYFVFPKMKKRVSPLTKESTEKACSILLYFSLLLRFFFYNRDIFCLGTSLFPNHVGIARNDHCGITRHACQILGCNSHSLLPNVILLMLHPNSNCLYIMKGCRDNFLLSLTVYSMSSVQNKCFCVTSGHSMNSVPCPIIEWSLWPSNSNVMSKKKVYKLCHYKILFGKMDGS